MGAVIKSSEGYVKVRPPLKASDLRAGQVAIIGYGRETHIVLKTYNNVVSLTSHGEEVWSGEAPYIVAGPYNVVGFTVEVTEP